MAYKTEDGQVFNFESDAQRHANNLASEQASRDSAALATAQTMAEDYEKIARDFNAGNWAETIKAANYENPLYHSFKKLTAVYADIWIMKEIALANSDPNYNCLDALFNTGYGKPYTPFLPSSKNHEKAKVLYQQLFNIGKKMWEKKNGRAWTDAEIAKAEAERKANNKNESVVMYENIILEYLNDPKKTHQYKNYSSSGVQSGTLSNKEMIKSCIDSWEKEAGRKFTKEDQIRIYGKPFIGALGRIIY